MKINPLKIYEHLKDKSTNYIIIFLLILGWQYLNQPTESEKEILKRLEELEIKSDNLVSEVKERSLQSEKVIKEYYHTKEIINNKYKEDEKSISDIDISNDSIIEYLSNYRYRAYFK